MTRAPSPSTSQDAAQEEKFKLIGELALDSPGLYKDLTRRLPDAALADLCAAYAEAAILGSLDDAPVQRAPGQSFNPRPGRLCQILLKELPTNDPSLLAAGFFLGCPPKNLKPKKTKKQHDFAIEKANALQALQAYTSSSEAHSPLPLPDLQQALLLARMLDDLRHLHMTSWKKPLQDRFVGDIKKILLPLSKKLKDTRLFVKVSSALERYERTTSTE